MDTNLSKVARIYSSNVIKTLLKIMNASIISLFNSARYIVLIERESNK